MTTLYTVYNEIRFKEEVNTALTTIRTILENTKSPGFPNEIQHEYEDKYTMANILTNNFIASQLACLQLLGVDKKKLAEMREFGKKHSVSLRFSSSERCWLDRKEEREVESPKTVTTVKVMGIGTSVSDVTKRIVDDYYFRFEMNYELFAYYRNEPEKKVMVTQRKGTCELVSNSNSIPYPSFSTIGNSSFDIDITWLMNHCDENFTPIFHINRGSKSCHTPRRNSDIKHALSYCVKFYKWLNTVTQYFQNKLFKVPKHSFDLNSINGMAKRVLVPPTPIFMNVEGTEDESHDVIPVKDDLDSILSEEIRALKATFEDVKKMINNEDKKEKKDKKDKKDKKGKDEFVDDFIHADDVNLVIILLHLQNMCQYYHDGVEYVEDMLRKQLIASIGKVVGPVDFANYMNFHNRRLFRSNYAPLPFSHAIRQPDHFPEGTIEIVCDMQDSLGYRPIKTICSKTETTEPMYFNINASTKIGFLGERYLHGFVAHQFAGSNNFSYELCASARQFSSYILVLGSIGTVDTFYPSHSIIVQNKDEVKIPLEFETIPPPKEFKEKISSLSPEQQRFAKAIRNYQLAGSLFGILVIHIKPQLEKLLRVPSDGLIKEIRLTQDLLELFLKYNIPSDQLSFGGQNFLKYNHKIDEVKRHVEEMQDLIEQIKEKDLNEENQMRAYADSTINMDVGYGTTISGRSNNKFFKPSNSPSPMIQPQRPPSQPQPVLQNPCEISKNISMEVSMDCDMRMSYDECEIEPICYKEEKKKISCKEMKPMKPQSRNRSLKQEILLDDFEEEMAEDYSEENYREIEPAALKVKYETPEEKREKRRIARDSAQKLQDEEEEKLKLVLGEQVFEEQISDQIIEARDYTLIPNKLDEMFERLDDDNALCTTTIKPGKIWTKKFNENLLADQSTTTLTTEQQKTEKNRAYDLLDAITRSGDLIIENANLHIVCAATHCFGESLMNTVICDNINPVEKVERSNLIVASVIHDLQPHDLIEKDQVNRAKLYSPKLFEDVSEKKAIKM